MIDIFYFTLGFIVGLVVYARLRQNVADKDFDDVTRGFIVIVSAFLGLFWPVTVVGYLISLFGDWVHDQLYGEKE